MKFGTLRKFLITAALAAVVGVSASATACSIETKRPRARITFELVTGDTTEEYVLDYDLYRNLYPNTVNHFIELAKAGYYDNTVIHDYETGEWYTGMYSYDKDAYSAAVSGDSGSVGEYFANHSKESEYLNLFNDGKIKPTVYANTLFKTDKNGNIVYVDKDGKTVSGDTPGASPVRVISKDYAMPSLIGEFKNNVQQTINNGALTATAGSLKMFYYPSNSSENASKSKVYVTPPKSGILQADSKYNCATSAFTVQVGASTNAESNYCVFGKVRNQDDLDDLKNAVADYFEDTYGSNSYVVKSSDVAVTVYEPMSGWKPSSGGKCYNARTVEEVFDAPKSAIRIVSVKITKN